MIDINKMYFPHDFYYKDISAKSLGVWINDKPDIPAAEENVGFKEVKGRNGSLTVRNKTYKDVEFDLDMYYVCEDEKHDAKFRKIKKWLSGSGDFATDENNGFCRKFKKITIGKNKRIGKNSGMISTRIVCAPFEYLIENIEFDNPTTIYNQYDYYSEPNYTITGNGLCTLTVNGNTFRVQVGTSATIDVSRIIAFNTSTGIVNNAMASGKYEDLRLHPGENTISISSGFNLSVVPNWRTL